MAYKKRELYEFKIPDGPHLTMERISESERFRFYRIEEARKNGQEDIHQNGEVYVSSDGVFNWLDEDESSHYTFETYGYAGLSEDILKYLNEHGEPE